MRKNKIWIQTDLAYAATKDKIRKQGVLMDWKDYEGRLTFWFKDLKDVTYQLTTKGKVGIFYPEGLNPQKALEKLKPYLVKADGSPASIKHLIKEKRQNQNRDIILTVEEPLPILVALKLFEQYPIKEIRVKKKNVLRRLWDFLTEASIEVPF